MGIENVAPEHKFVALAARKSPGDDIQYIIATPPLRGLACPRMQKKNMHDTHTDHTLLRCLCRSYHNEPSVRFRCALPGGNCERFRGAGSGSALPWEIRIAGIDISGAFSRDVVVMQNERGPTARVTTLARKGRWDLTPLALNIGFRHISIYGV